MHRLLRGVSSLSAAEVLRVASGALLSVFLARRLGAPAFGLWTFALAVTAYPLALVEAGLTWIGSREVAQDHRVLRPLVRTIVSLRLTLAVFGLLAVAVVLVAVREPAADRLVVVLAGTSLMTTAIALDWVFYGLQRPAITAGANVTRVVVFTTASLFIIRRPDQVWIVPLLQASGELAASVQMWVLYRRWILPTGTPVNPVASPLSLLRQSAPLTVSQLLRAVTIWSGVTVIAMFSTSAAVGNFGAAQRLSQLVGGFATLYFYGYLPLASRAVLEGAAAIEDLVSRSVRLTTRVSVPFALGITLLARPLVLIVFGRPFADAAPVLQILVWTVPVAILGGHFRHTLVAARRTGLDLYAVATGAVVTLGLNLALVPTVGLVGAALAPLTGETTVTVIAMALVARYIRRILPIGPLLRAVVPTAVMGLAIAATRPYGFTAAVTTGALTYLVALVARRDLTWADLAAFLGPDRHGRDS